MALRGPATNGKKEGAATAREQTIRPGARRILSTSVARTTGPGRSVSRSKQKTYIATIARLRLGLKDLKSGACVAALLSECVVYPERRNHASTRAKMSTKVAGVGVGFVFRMRKR